ncbi:MAG TPA: PQQ-dependent sugar dehydrogenase, partial [Polyangiales bacterium]
MRLTPKLWLPALLLVACSTNSPRSRVTDDSKPGQASSSDAGPSMVLPTRDGSVVTDPARDAGELGAGSDAGLDDDIPDAKGPPVTQGAPNVPEFKPAFPQQTRAPAMVSKTKLKVTELATLGTPWALAFLPDGRMLATEKLNGRMFIITATGTKSPAITGLPAVDAGGQGGLMDVEVGPDYAQSSLIYWSYYEARQGGGNGLTVARGKLNAGATPSVSNVQVIFRMEPALASDKHAGGRLVFAPDDMLYITLGERSIVQGRVQARDLKSHLGKVVRIHPDGTVPTDNPFVNTQDARPQIWSLGHRNILAAALDGQNRLWITEMGPQGGDELNLVQRGKDYGWPTIGYGEDYSGAPLHQQTQADGLEQPVYYWDPVISPSGMTIYSGTLFSEWRGDFFIGGL